MGESLTSRIRVWWEKTFRENTRLEGSSFQKLTWDEIFKIYYEHQAYDDKDLFKLCEKKVNKKGNTVFKSEGDDLINTLENLVGEDNIEDASKILNEYYTKRKKELLDKGVKH